MRWQDKLTAEERKHLREEGITTLSAFRTMRGQQRATMLRWGRSLDIPSEVAHGCMDCRKIAEKLDV